MTVETTQAFLITDGDGSTVDFPFDFPCFVAGWMNGLEDRIPVAGSAVLNDDQNENPGGVFTFDVAPAVGVDNVVVVRIADFLQQTHYLPVTKFPSSLHEAALDKLTMITQQLAYTIALLEGDTSLYVLKLGDIMLGPLQVVDETGPDDAIKRQYADDINAALEAAKADKSVQLLSDDVNHLQVTDPSLADDITIAARTNLGNGLLALNAAGMIDPEFIPDIGGGALRLIGLWDAGPGTLPPDADLTGDTYLITDPGTLTLFTFDSPETPVATPVLPTDSIVWVNEDNEQDLEEGWWYLPLSQYPRIASTVLVDDSGWFITAANVQEAFDVSLPLLEAVIAESAASTAQVALNTPAIAQNVDDISDNADAIGVNTGAISALETAVDGKADLEGGNTFTDTQNFEGLVNVPNRAGELQEAGWRPIGVSGGPGDRDFTSEDIGQTIYIENAGTYTIPIGIANFGDMIQIITNTSFTLGVAGGVLLVWLQGGTSETGDRTIATTSVITLYYVGADSWRIWGNGIS